MALSFFDDKSAPPSEGALQTALGPSAELWRELIPAEGRGVRLEIRKPRELSAVETLAAAKMAT